MKLKRVFFLSSIVIFGLSFSISSDINASSLKAASSELYSPQIESLVINKISKNGADHANGNSTFPAISRDGRFISFESDASNLVDGDTNDVTDVFVKDNRDDSIVRVSVNNSGEQATLGGFDADISGDGRFVVFASVSQNLVSSGNALGQNLYLHDRDADGDLIFDEPGAIETKRISEHPQDEYNVARRNARPAISGDGCIVAFESDVINFMPDTNWANDIYVYNCHNETIVRASESSSGYEGNYGASYPAISFDGNWVAFLSISSNLISSPSDTNGLLDVYVKELKTGYLELVSISTEGEQQNRDGADWNSPALSEDGNFIVFGSTATNFAQGVDSNTNIFVRDRRNDNDPTTGITSFINHTFDYRKNTNGATLPDISGDGRFVVYYSGDPNIVPGGDQGWGDIYLHDRDYDADAIFDEAGATNNQRVSANVYGNEGNVFSSYPAISQDGRYVTFSSDAINLVSEDTIGLEDVYVRGCHLSGTPIYLQGFPSTADSVPNSRPEWYDDIYGNNPADATRETMGRWGCNTTCNAMMIDYAAFISGNSFRTDPGLLNNWLRNFNGYNPENGVRYYRVSDYVSEQMSNEVSVKWLTKKPYGENTNLDIENHICSGKPVMLHVDMGTNDGHFVLVTGVATVNGQRTFIIHDPKWGATTLLEKYNNHYLSANFFSAGPNPNQPSSLIISVESPIHIIVTDPLQRKTGYDPRYATEWFEIPNAYYGEEWITDPDDTSLPQGKYFSLADPLPGTYSIQVIGFDDGPYRTQVDYNINNVGSKMEVFTGTASVGSVDIFTFIVEDHYVYLPLVINR